MSLSNEVFKSTLRRIKPYFGGKGRPDQEGLEIHKLSSNENPFGSSPIAMAAARHVMNNVSEYPPQTDYSLREALSVFYNYKLDVDQFITGNGGVAIIAMIVEAFLDANSSCIVSNPCFLPYIQFAEKAGARVIDVPLEGDDYQLNVQGILNAIDETTRVIWLCSPNNPTGTIIPKTQMDALMEHVPDHVVVVYDEVYFQYVEDASYFRGYEYVERGYNVIGINSFSKAYGLAGLRVGYAYATKEIAQYINTAKRPFMLNTVSMEAAKGALKDADFINETVSAAIRNKHELYKSIDALSIKYTKTDANFVLVDPEMPTIDFESKMAALGVMVRPADAFGAPGLVRVTIGTSANNRAFIKACQSVMRK